MKKFVVLLLVVSLFPLNCFAMSRTMKIICKTTILLGAGYLIYDGLRYVDKGENPKYKKKTVGYIVEKYNPITGEWEITSGTVITTNELVKVERKRDTHSYTEAIIGACLLVGDIAFFPTIDKETKTASLNLKKRF
jgi:hypothetical protein